MDQKKLKIAYHETGHAVMALVCGRSIQKISLKEMDSPRGTGKYLGFMKPEPVDPDIKFRADQKIGIALGGFASEILFFDGLTHIGGDDLTVSEKTAEDMLEDTEFKNMVAGLPAPNPGVIDLIENPLARAYIDYMIGFCVERLAPLKPAIQMIAEELYKREELTGDEVDELFYSFMQSSLGAD